ncbi:PREDICTED: mucin-5AC-like isoform X2 [Polistes canadensis]|uniref:mucin-5AC-like isoform X2 n=1 Tax=Polistes canadensis TaxID=91411 RepID=UPI000718C5F2|nr:PREDICTED: mucin-5AC-like isoform X2 [Polistes canadensis]
MLEFESRVVVVSLSLLSGCILLYNAWGPVLAVVISLFLVVYVCYSLITNDSLLSPHAYFFLNYFKETALELKIVIEKFIVYLLRYFNIIWSKIKYFFGVSLSTVKMKSRRSSGYQLSSDTTFNSRNTSRFGIIPQLSPIPRTSHKQHISDISNVSENKINQDDEYQSHDSSNRYNKYTSTLLSVLKKNELHRLEPDTLETSLPSPRKNSPMFNQNHTLTRGENNTSFSPEGSPWGTSISPKMRSKAGGVKTVQTVAGPLLASTRYNIDPKTYTDITSPGLTLRLTKYAAEANNKLTHQSQYSAGQFPKVNLHASPIPLINTKFAKTRGPVTVRVAPPETTKYSPQERQKILSDICQSENKSPSSVVQVLKEISLKRHASREDVTTDIVKKQRTDNMLINEVDNFEETKQKRGREESPKSDDDNLSKNLRPTKRSKTPSCYDILRSLSSSIHVATGIKRKAVDCSRCGTPEFEKHFKSLKDSQHEDSHSHIDLQIINKEDIDALNENKKRCASSHSYKSLNNTQKQSCVKGILKPFSNTKNYSESKVVPTNEEDIKPYEDEEEDNNSSLTTTKYTDKLFMKEEPKRNDKLKSFEEEQKHLIDAGFTTNDIEEIKKKDIVNMRQTSMRARLQSMFDAISGKASGINPDVVIQAEEISEVAPAISSSTDCATLNSITTTTNVNTTPIITSALAPTLTPSKILSNTKPVKHITFNLPNTENISGTKEQSTSNLVSDDKNKSIITSETSICKTDATPTSLELTNMTTKTNSPSVTTISFIIPRKTVTDTLPVTTSVTPVIVSPVASNGILKSSTSIINSSTSSTNVPSTTVILSIPSTSTSLFTNKSTIANTATSPSFSDTTNIKTSIGKSFLPNVTNTGFTMSTDFPKFNFGNIANTTESTQINTVSVQNTTSSLSFTTDIKSMFTAPANVGSITAGSGGGVGAASVFPNIADNSTSSTFKNFSTTTTSSVPFIFGSNTASTPKTEVSLFNTTTSNAPRTFGISGITQTIPISSNTSIIPNNPPTTTNTILNLTSSTFSGNASSGSTTFTFSTTKPIFSFGTSNASTAENKPTFSYNTNALENSTGLLGSTNTPVASTTSNNTTSGFNIPGVTSSTQFSTTTVSMFNTPSTTTASMFNTPSTTAASMFNTPATTTASIFNTPATTTMFRTTTSEPVFGQSIAAPIFGNTTKTPFVPIQSTKSTIEFGTGNNNFKEDKPPAFGSNTTVFGSSSTPLFGSQTTAPPTFGSPSVSTSTLNFDSTNTTTAVFGAPNLSAPGNTQSSTVHNFVILTTPNPIFGNQNNSVPSFGSTTTTPVGTFNTPMQSTFETQQSTPLPFGAASNSNAFGDNKASPFGIQTTVTPAFPTNENNTSSIFTFGGNQGGQQQQSNTFSFGNNNASNNNVSTTGPVPFQFGANTSKPVTGFNFTAPSTTPSLNFGTSGSTPTFNAPTPGMFSIGSGSTAPRSRATRGRKPR